MVTDEMAGMDRPNEPGQGPRRLGNSGFSLVEVIIAIVVLAVGLLGLAGTTVLVIKQTTLADVATDRSVALQSSIERIKATPYDSIRAGGEDSGLFEVAWSVQDGGQWKSVDFVTTGPGLSTREGFPSISHSVADTFSYRIIRP